MTETRRTRRAVLRAGGATLAAHTAGCLSGGSGPRTVAMTEELGFDPEQVSIGTGTTVEWVNESDVGHTVTAYGDEVPAGATYFASGRFETEQAARTGMPDGLVDPDESFSHAFEQSGGYEYYCIPHEGSGMVGTVLVR